jgi:quercetin dioxygenase-like cupin family protein
MRRRSFPLIVLALVGLVLTGRWPSQPVRAQDATPSAGMFPPGVTAQPLAVAPGLPLSSPSDLVLVRLTIAPGTVFPNDPNDPSLALVYVESGTLTLHFTTPLVITRASAMATLATPDAAFPAPEQVAANATATLNAGDSVVAPPNAGGDVRNEGTAPVVLLAAIVAPSSMGTPAATPTA